MGTNQDRPDGIARAAGELREGRTTSSALVAECLQQIARHESAIKAWVLVDEAQARRAALQCDRELRAGKCRGQLHGIPIGIKDLIDCEGWPTLAGTTLRSGHVAHRDAPLVARLRAAGAVILGKTVTTEFACFDPAATANPWNLACTPGGSSSGSAAAVATGMCLAAIGSQTGGSITRPASFCGVAGLKPTFGRVPLEGIVPLTRRLDHPGPIARRVFDLAVVLSAIAGYDPLDASTANVPIDDYAAGLTHSPVPRLGVWEKYFLERCDDDIRNATREAVRALGASGAEICTIDLPQEFADVHRRHRTVMAVEAASCHGGVLRDHGDALGPHVRGLLEEGLAATTQDYAEALYHQTLFRRAVELACEPFDAVVTPATVTAALPTRNSTGDPAFNSPFSFAGVPTVSIPCGLTSAGLPAALQLVGPPFGERRLLSAAARCEAALGFRFVPDMMSAT